MAWHRMSVFVLALFLVSSTAPDTGVHSIGEDWWGPIAPAVTPHSVGVVGRATTPYDGWPHEHLYARQPRPQLARSEWSKWNHLSDTLHPLRDKLREWGGPFKIRRMSEDGGWGVRLTERALFVRLHNWMPHLLDNETLAIKSRATGFVVLVRANVRFIIVNLEDGSNAIDHIYAALRWTFKRTWRAGSPFACRRVAGTWTWSQHAWGNALDIFASRDRMYAISRFLARRAPRLPVQQVIYARQTWTSSASYWHYYGGSNPHYDHVHVTGFPYRTGTPPCAS